MCALTPTPLLQGFGWPLDNPMIHHQSNYLLTHSFEFDPSQQQPPPQPQIQLDRSASFTTNSSGDPTMAKKFYHNASERDRRRKINTLYSSLRSLLPATDHNKKQSIPATVSRVLKYIPELQQQVKSLNQKKEELLARQGEDVLHVEKQRKALVGRSSLFSVTASRLSDREVVIQISAYRLHENPLSEILLSLEEDGLMLMNASSFESSAGRVFYNLHFQVERSYLLECGVLSEKLLSSYEKTTTYCFNEN